MQTFEIPDADNDLHIVVKRPNPPKPALLPTDQLVTREMFLEFANAMSSSINKIVDRLSNLENMISNLSSAETTVQNQEYEDEQELAETENQFIDEDDLEVLEELQIEDDTEHSVVIQEVRHCRKSEPLLKKIKLEKVLPKPMVELRYIETENERTEEVVTADETKQNLTFDEFTLPVTTVEQLMNLNMALEKNKSLVSEFRTKMASISEKSDSSFQRALSLLISDNVLFKMNWGGFKGKTKMADMILFKTLIHDEWFSNLNYEEYVEQVKMITKKAHKRYSKNQERKRNRESGRHSSLHSSMEADQTDQAVRMITLEEGTGEGNSNIVLTPKIEIKRR